MPRPFVVPVLMLTRTLDPNLTCYESCSFSSESVLPTAIFHLLEQSMDSTQRAQGRQQVLLNHLRLVRLSILNHASWRRWTLP